VRLIPVLGVTFWLALLFGWYKLLFLPLLSARHELDHQIVQTENELSLLHQDIKHYAELAEKSAILEAELEEQTRDLITGANPMEVAQKAQEIIVSFAYEQQLEVVSYKVGRKRKWNGLYVVDLEMEFNGNTDQIVGFLKDVDESCYSVRIKKVNISSGMGVGLHGLSLVFEALFVPSLGG